MAIGTNTYTTYDTTGMREDLIDVIANIDPVSTWFQSNIGSARASQRYHEWLLDSLAAPAANVQIEGDSLTATAITPPVRSGNYCQILNKKFSITETEEVTDKAGRNSEVAYQKANKLKELANDIEYALIINASAVSGGTATARQLKGLSGWITSNNITGTGTVSSLIAGSGNDTIALISSGSNHIFLLRTRIIRVAKIHIRIIRHIF